MDIVICDCVGMVLPMEWEDTVYGENICSPVPAIVRYIITLLGNK